jgi:uncharacterized protein (TIGR04141 family)
MILTEGAIDKLNNIDSHSVSFPSYGDGSSLYIFTGMSLPPKWVKQINNHFGLSVGICTNSASGVLIFKSSERIFAATFGQGWMYLNAEFLVNDFGLRASINALDERKLNRLERTNLGDALRGSALSPFQRTFTSFGVDDALELVRKIGGSTKSDISADTMTGAQSLKISGEIGLGDLPRLADDALTLFEANDYQNTAFAVLDVLKPVSDFALIEALNNKAVEHIQNNDDNFELGLPGGYVDDVVSYQFSGPGLRGLHPDLHLRDYVEALGEKLVDLDIATLRAHQIIANYDDDSKPNQSWSIRSALVGSMDYSTGLYAINEGTWYSINEAFKTSVEERFQDLVQPFDLERIVLTKLVSPDAKKIKHESELSYNTKCAEAYGFVLLDQKLISIPDIQFSSFESCDLLDINNKKFIHVKKSSRSSSVLSHFFKQGANSAKNFKMFPSCISALHTKINAEYGMPLATQFEQVCQTDGPWSVEFWIVDKPRANGTFNIPFFSKISLKDEVTNLHAMDYKVTLRFIDQG